jgi:hypothetical protein
MITKFFRNVFIDSEINSIGNGQVGKINFPSSSFSVAPKETMKLTLTSFDMRRSWYNINPSNNTFYWYDPTQTVADRYKPIVIQEGNYTDFGTSVLPQVPGTLASAIEQAIAVIPALATTTVSYNPIKRKFILILPAGLSPNSRFVAFQVKENANQPQGVSNNGYFNDVAEILGGYSTRDGWTPGSPVDLFSGSTAGGNVATTQSSPFVASLNTLEAIYLRTNLHSGNYQTYGFEKDLPNQQGLTPTDIFARISLNRAYFDPQFEFVSFEDPNGLFSMLLTQTQLSQVYFAITDDKGRLIEEVAGGQAKEGNLNFKMSFRWEVLVDDLPPDERRIRAENLLKQYPNLVLN